MHHERGRSVVLSDQQDNDDFPVQWQHYGNCPALDYERYVSASQGQRDSVAPSGRRYGNFPALDYEGYKDLPEQSGQLGSNLPERDSERYANALPGLEDRSKV